MSNVELQVKLEFLFIKCILPRPGIYGTKNPIHWALLKDETDLSKKTDIRQSKGPILCLYFCVCNPFLDSEHCLYCLRKKYLSVIMRFYVIVNHYWNLKIKNMEYNKDEVRLGVKTTSTALDAPPATSFT